MRAKLLVLGACVLLGARVGRAQTRPIEGNWRSPTGSVIKVYRCAETECLKIMQVEKDAPSGVDGKNPDPKLQTRPLCGLEIGSGFKPAEDGRSAEGGSLYDPKSGRTYRGSLTADGDVLKLRGYVGVKMFGRNEEWSRVKEAVEVCR